jgi:hypothetical protein
MTHTDSSDGERIKRPVYGMLDNDKGFEYPSRMIHIRGSLSC